MSENKIIDTEETTYDWSAFAELQEALIAAGWPDPDPDPAVEPASCIWRDQDSGGLYTELVLHAGWALRVRINEFDTDGDGVTYDNGCRYNAVLLVSPTREEFTDLPGDKRSNMSRADAEKALAEVWRDGSVSSVEDLDDDSEQTTAILDD